MSKQQSSLDSQSMTIQFEVMPEDAQQTDIADVDEVGRSLVGELRSNRFAVTPTYTGKRGGSVFDILVQVPQFIHDNKDLLLGILDSVAIALQCLLLSSERRAEKEKEQRDPIKLILEVNDKSVTIDRSDVENGTKLREKLQRTHPDEIKKITTRSNMKIKASVPRKKRRPRNHSH